MKDRLSLGFVSFNSIYWEEIAWMNPDDVAMEFPSERAFESTDFRVLITNRVDPPPQYHDIIPTPNARHRGTFQRSTIRVMTLRVVSATPYYGQTEGLTLQPFTDGVVLERVHSIAWIAPLKPMSSPRAVPSLLVGRGFSQVSQSLQD